MRAQRTAKAELLSQVPLFAGCSKKELGYIAGVADEVDFGAGRTLIRQGERGREFFVLESGTVRVTEDGRTLRDLGPGDWFGEIALVSDVPRTTTVETTSPVVLFVITDRAFAALVKRSPSIALKVLASLGARLAPQPV